MDFLKEFVKQYSDIFAINPVIYAHEKDQVSTKTSYICSFLFFIISIIIFSDALKSFVGYEIYNINVQNPNRDMNA